MPGFLISNLENTVQLKDPIQCSCVRKEMRCGDTWIRWNTLSKFMYDKTFFQNDEYIVIHEGVLLNKNELFELYLENDIESLIIRMYTRNKDTFFNDFRGSFSGAIYNKRKDEWIIYTNHYGDNTIFYYFVDGKLVVGSRLNYISDTLKQNDIKYSFNENAAVDMLSYAYMCDNKTWINEVQRLYPGHYLKIKNDKIHDIVYYRVSQDKYDLKDKSDDEIIEEIDRRMRYAVKMEYLKDLEYGYRHLTQLSGGLDSRMNFWISKELGMCDVLCMTFGQSNHDDTIIAERVSSKKNSQIIVWPLNSAEHLMYLDEYIHANNGLALYSGVGAEFEIMKSLNMDSFGLMHTGQLGDVVIGTFIGDIREVNDLSVGGLYSTLIERKNDIDDLYQNREQYLMMVRGFLGCLSSHQYTQCFTQVASPFLNVDVIDYCLSIPVAKRIRHKMYKKYILAKYPEAGRIQWEKTGATVDASDFKIKAIHYAKSAKKFIQYPETFKARFGLGRKKSIAIKYTGMNPFDRWWEENKKLREYFISYYSEMIPKVNCSKGLKENIKNVFEKGGASEKTQVLTILSVYKALFMNEES